MRLSDILIIYLACGAPCGVYFFLQHRNRVNTAHTYLKSFLLVFVWIPYALRLLHDFVTRHYESNRSENLFADRLDALQKQISRFINYPHSNISVFEFREIIERYAGLTAARLTDVESQSKTDEEIYRVALRENIKLGARCLRRRNRLLIERHQISARNDFLQLVSQIIRPLDGKEIENLEILTSEFVKTLRDTETLNLLNKVFENNLQSATENSVKYLETKEWNPEQHKRLSPNRIPARLQAMAAARKD